MRNYGAPLPATDGGTGTTTAAAELVRIGAVGYGAAQSLTAAQQAQALSNIGAAPASGQLTRGQVVALALGSPF